MQILEGIFKVSFGLILYRKVSKGAIDKLEQILYTMVV